MRNLRNDINAQLSLLFAPFFGLVGIGIGLYDIFLSGGAIGSTVTSGGLFGAQPFNIMGVAVAAGVFIAIIAVVGLVIWAIRSQD